MGMTIDKSRQLLSQYQKLFNSLNGDYKLSLVQISELSHSIGTAIETMHKYQKISDAIKFADDNGLGYEYIGEKVYEVFIYDR